MSESNGLTLPNDTDGPGWAAHWQAQGMPWRTEPEVDPNRQAWLAERRGTAPDIGQMVYPFYGVALSRADVEWLLATHESDGYRGPVDWSDPAQRTRTGLDLRGAVLTGVHLERLPLARLRGGLTDDEQDVWGREYRYAAAIQLQHAHLSFAHLEGACLARARLDEANAESTNFTAADLGGAHCEGVLLKRAVLAGAYLRGAYFDQRSNLNGCRFQDAAAGSARIVDTRWSDVNLAVVDWGHVTQLGEEQRAQRLATAQPRASRPQRLRALGDAVRANRQLAIALREQGLSEDADRFAYRAQVLQRQVLRHQRSVSRWLFSALLALLSGYGYRLGRILIAYALFVCLFAVLYLVLSAGCPVSSLPQVVAVGTHCASGGHTYGWVEALVVSVTAFHGRVFSEGYGADTLFGITAAVEAVVGLVIEGVFIAMLTQRYFGR